MIDRRAFISTLANNMLTLLVAVIAERHELFSERTSLRILEQPEEMISRHRLINLNRKLKRLRRALRIVRLLRDSVEPISNAEFEAIMDLRYEFFGAFDDIELRWNEFEQIPGHGR